MWKTACSHSGKLLALWGANTPGRTFYLLGVVRGPFQTKSFTSTNLFTDFHYIADNPTFEGTKQGKRFQAALIHIRHHKNLLIRFCKEVAAASSIIAPVNFVPLVPVPPISWKCCPWVIPIEQQPGGHDILQYTIHQ